MEKNVERIEEGIIQSQQVAERRFGCAMYNLVALAYLCEIGISERA